MSETDAKELEKEARRLKRIAGEWAAQMHDLVEERLPAAFEEIPALAQSLYDACKSWRDAESRLTTLTKGT